MKRNIPLKRTVMKRSSKPMNKVRAKPRPGRLKGKDMESLRRMVFERDGYRCQHVIEVRHVIIAGEDREFNVFCLNPVTWDTGHLAHIVSRGRGGQDTPENTCCKCAECHLIREHHEGGGGKIIPPKNGG